VDGVWIGAVGHVEPLGTTCVQVLDFFASALISASRVGPEAVDANSFGVSAGVAVSGVLYCARGPIRLTAG
jgi:hypothetical protein